jgi:2,6-dihydroxypyridine 3-monooxygenase
VTDMPRVAVAGGSIGGLTAALVLRDIGCDVDVYERSSAALEARGAGIGVLSHTARYPVERLGLSQDRFCSSTDLIRFLRADGSVQSEREHRYHFSSWNTIYRLLHDAFGGARYHLGTEMSSFTSDDDGVSLSFRAHPEQRVDLLVCADGIKSRSRRTLLPEVTPRYAGYVAWRGVVPESDLSRATFDAMYDALTYQVLDASHILVYPIPDNDGRTAPGDRLMNIVWYRNVDARSELTDLLTDRTGHVHEVALPPGAVREELLEEVRTYAEAHLAPPIAEVVTSIPELFAQAVFDIDVPRMAFGRACLVGDAAFAARPHAAAGTAKAAEDGWVLAEELERAGGDVPRALSAWQERQLALGHRLLERARDVGTASQVSGTFGPDHDSLIFGLYAPGR